MGFMKNVEGRAHDGAVQVTAVIGAVPGSGF